MKYRYTYLLAFLLGITLACTPAEKAPTEKPNAASVNFVNLKDGDTVQNPFTVKFGVSGMTVVKMGAAGGADKGHHHLIIDGKPIEYGQMVPMNPTHLHFMGGETEHSLSLAPGKHTLTLQFAGTDHRSFGTPLSKTITVNVTGPMPAKTEQKQGMDHAGHHGHHAMGASGSQKPSTGERRVYFQAPLNNQVVPTSLSLRFGVDGMTVTPAGQLIDSAKHGHHHLIIDAPGVKKGQVVPADEKHIHFGKGQTETRITLSEGPHTLTLQFADGAHRSFGPELSETIRVTAKEMYVFFKSPADKSTISAKGKLQFGAFGVQVTPAGQFMNDMTRGHHHLIINGKPVPRGQVVPADKTHIHFGKGQTEVELASLNLTPGKYTFTLQFADGAHRSMGPEMSKTIQVELK